MAIEDGLAEGAGERGQQFGEHEAAAIAGVAAVVAAGGGSGLRNGEAQRTRPRRGTGTLAELAARGAGGRRSSGRW